MGRVIDNKSWKIIEIAILRYPSQKKKLQELLEDIVLSKGQPSGKTNFDEEYSKPQSVTEAKAMKLNSAYYKKLKKEVDAVEKVYNSLPEIEKKIMKTRYWSNPKKKIPYVDIDCGYSERQMKRIIFRIIFRVGVELGELEGKEINI